MGLEQVGVRGATPTSLIGATHLTPTYPNKPDLKSFSREQQRNDLQLKLQHFSIMPHE